MLLNRMSSFIKPVTADSNAAYFEFRLYYDKNIPETEGEHIHYRVKQDITQTLNQFHNHN